MIALRTVSGRRIDLELLQPDDITIDDIACGLSRCCRFAGQIRQHYSVAQHSILVSTLVPLPRLRLAALLHDASEAYLGDVSRNLKHSTFLQGYRVLEERVTEAIEARYKLRLTVDDRDQIKTADDLAACFEHIVLRDQQPFTDARLHALLEEHFVRSHSLDLMPFVPRLPSRIPAMPIARIEQAFYTAFTMASCLCPR